MEEYRTKTATIRKLEANILETIVDKDAILEVEDIWEIKRVNREICAGKPYAVLVDSGMYTSISEEARKLTASKEFQQLTLAKAVLVNSLAQRIIGRFYLQINRPAIKTRLFNDREQAILWLKQQLTESINLASEEELMSIGD